MKQGAENHAIFGYFCNFHQYLIYFQYQVNKKNSFIFPLPSNVCQKCTHSLNCVNNMI